MLLSHWALRVNTTIQWRTQTSGRGQSSLHAGAGLSLPTLLSGMGLADRPPRASPLLPLSNTARFCAMHWAIAVRMVAWAEMMAGKTIPRCSPPEAKDCSCPRILMTQISPERKSQTSSTSTCELPLIACRCFLRQGFGVAAVTEQDTPLLPHRLCRAAPSRFTRIVCHSRFLFVFPRAAHSTSRCQKSWKIVR